MKKITLISVAVLAALTLTACSSGKTSSSSSSSSSASSSSQAVASSSAKTAATTKPSSKAATPQVTGMNIQQIAKGDFSSIVGTWKNNEGLMYIFTKNAVYFGSSMGMDQIKLGGLSVEGKRASAGVTFGMGGWGVMFYPKGVALSNPKDASYKDVSNKSKDRILTGQNLSDGSDAFYKVSNSTTLPTPKASSSTAASSTASQASGMNLQAVYKGDFSSIAGTWKNGAGQQLTMSKDGVVNSKYPITAVQLENGFVSAENHTPWSSGTILIIPAGVKAGKVDVSDTSKLRLLYTTQPNNRLDGITDASVLKTDLYYKVD